MDRGNGDGQRNLVLRRQAEPRWNVDVELCAACPSARRRVPEGPRSFDAFQRGIRAAQSAMYARGAMSRGWQGQRSQAQHAARRSNRAIMPVTQALRYFAWSPNLSPPGPPPAEPPAQPPHGPPLRRHYTATQLHVPPVEPPPEPPAAPPPAYNPAAMGPPDWQSLIGDGRALRGRRSKEATTWPTRYSWSHPIQESIKFLTGSDTGVYAPRMWHHATYPYHRAQVTALRNEPSPAMCTRTSTKMRDFDESRMPS